MLIYSSEIKEYPEDRIICIFTRVKDGYGIQVFPNKKCTKEESKVFGYFSNIVDGIEYCIDHSIDIIIPDPRLFEGINKEKLVMLRRDYERDNKRKLQRIFK